MRKYSVLVVEDNFLTRRMIKKLLEENNYLVYESSNSISSMQIIQNETIDIAILDINLGFGTNEGIQLANELKNVYKIPFLYLTAYGTKEILQSALHTKPSSYITKPFKNIDLLAAIDIALQKKNEKGQSITVKEDEYFIDIPIDEINYIESDGNYVLIYLENHTYKYRSTIKNIMDILPAEKFLRTHRAFIVNKEKIEKYSPKHLIVKNKQIPISKNFIVQI